MIDGVVLVSRGKRQGFYRRQSPRMEAIGVGDRS